MAVENVTNFRDLIKPGVREMLDPEAAGQHTEIALGALIKTYLNQRVRGPDSVGTGNITALESIKYFAGDPPFTRFVVGQVLEGPTHHGVDKRAAEILLVCDPGLSFTRQLLEEEKQAVGQMPEREERNNREKHFKSVLARVFDVTAEMIGVPDEWVTPPQKLNLLFTARSMVDNILDDRGIAQGWTELLDKATSQDALITEKFPWQAVIKDVVKAGVCSPLNSIAILSRSPAEQLKLAVVEDEGVRTNFTTFLSAYIRFLEEKRKYSKKALTKERLEQLISVLNNLPTGNVLVTRAALSTVLKIQDLYMQDLINTSDGYKPIDFKQADLTGLYSVLRKQYEGLEDQDKTQLVTSDHMLLMATISRGAINSKIATDFDRSAGELFVEMLEVSDYQMVTKAHEEALKNGEEYQIYGLLSLLSLLSTSKKVFLVGNDKGLPRWVRLVDKTGGSYRGALNLVSNQLYRDDPQALIATLVVAGRDSSNWLSACGIRQENEDLLRARQRRWEEKFEAGSVAVFQEVAKLLDGRVREPNQFIAALQGLGPPEGITTTSYDSLLKKSVLTLLLSEKVDNNTKIELERTFGSETVSLDVYSLDDIWRILQNSSGLRSIQSYYCRQAIKRNEPERIVEAMKGYAVATDIGLINYLVSADLTSAQLETLVSEIMPFVTTYLQGLVGQCNLWAEPNQSPNQVRRFLSSYDRAMLHVIGDPNSWITTAITQMHLLLKRKPQGAQLTQKLVNLLVAAATVEKP